MAGQARFVHELDVAVPLYLQVIFKVKTDACRPNRDGVSEVRLVVEHLLALSQHFRSWRCQHTPG